MTEFLKIILESKDEYYDKLTMKLNNSKTNSQTYWSVIEAFYDDRRIPIISPPLKDGKLDPDFKIKANYLNNFFASQKIA